MSACFPINTSFHYRLLSSLTRTSHPAPEMFLNHHTAGQESLSLLALRQTLSILLCPCGVFKSAGIPSASGKPKPFLLPSLVKCLVVAETSYTFTEGDKLRFSERGNGVKHLDYNSFHSRVRHLHGSSGWITPISLPTNDDVSTEGSKEASITSPCGEFY